MDVMVTTTIDRPPTDVAAFAMNPTNEPEWIGGIQSSRVLTPGPVRVGTQVERVAAFLGRRFAYVLEATTFDPGQQVIMTSVRAPFAMRVTYRFEPVDGGCATRVVNRVEGGPGGVYRVAGPLVRLAVRRSLS